MREPRQPPSPHLTSDVLRSARQEAAEVLARLPLSADGIANALVAENCRGYRARPHSCPLALYLARRISLPFPLALAVETDEVVFYDRDVRLGGTVPLSAAAAQFTLSFDYALYPALLAEF